MNLLILGNRGSSIILAMVVVATMCVLSATILNWSKVTVERSRQINVPAISEQVKNKIINNINSPWAWNINLAQNAPLIAQAQIGGVAYTNLPDSAKMLDLYSADSTGGATLFYAATDPTAGFNVYGNPCVPADDGVFDPVNGNPKCPFRYDVILDSRLARNGTFVDVIRIIFKHVSNDGIVAGSPLGGRYSYTFVRNFQEKSTETTCVAVGGTYSTATGVCSVKIAPDAICGAGNAYEGPSIPGYCDSYQLAFNCGPGTVIVGFTNTPTCRTVQP